MTSSIFRNNLTLSFLFYTQNNTILMPENGCIIPKVPTTLSFFKLHAQCEINWDGEINTRL